MKKPEGYDETMAAGQWNPLAPGGYVCRILSAREGRTQKGKPQLELALDIAEGPETGRFQRQFSADPRPEARWPAGGVLRQLTENADGSCNPYFKSLMTAIGESNPGWKPQWGDCFCDGLKGKLVGVVFRREQYQKQNGDLAWSTRALWARSADAVRQGVEVPEDKFFESPEAFGGSGFEGRLPF